MAPTVLVTGCSAGGIGYALCVAFREAGCNVIASARRKEAMAGLEERGCELLEMDVADEASVRSAASVIERADILVNNAGQGLMGPMVELPIDDMKALYEVNVFGLIRMTQAAFPSMAKRGHGKIVNIASIVGVVCTPFAGAYCSSKAAVISVSDAMRNELRPFGIDVITVLPGAVKSRIGDNNAARVSRLALRFFEPALPAVAARAQASQSQKSTPTEEFAQRVVRGVLSEKPPARLWVAAMSTLFYVMSWLPVWVTDAAMSRKFGLKGTTAELLRLKAAALRAEEKGQ